MRSLLLALVATTILQASGTDQYELCLNDDPQQCNSNEQLVVIDNHFGPPQKVSNHTLWQHILTYMSYSTSNCRNQHEDCTLWAQQGECDSNPHYMKQRCGPSCLQCCPTYTPQFINVTDILHQIQQQHRGLFRHDNLLQVDDFLTPQECQMVMDYQQSQPPAPSTTQNPVAAVRTSTTLWCDAHCQPQIAPVLTKLHNLMPLPNSYAEDLQLLRYDLGQEYKLHHDYIMAQPPRLLTVLVYLSEGGPTNFPLLHQSIQPACGRLVVWSNVIWHQEDWIPDRTTYHQALPHDSRVKYAANLWWHAGDFQTPFQAGCLE